MPNIHSQTRFTCERSHQPTPEGRGALAAPSAFSSPPAPTGPSSFTAASTSSTMAGSCSTSAA